MLWIFHQFKNVSSFGIPYQIIEQLKALGCSYDWERTRFTLDEGYYRAVQQAFVHFYERSWLYRGHRVVNWCPECDSTVSDLEVQHTDHHGNVLPDVHLMPDGSTPIDLARNIHTNLAENYILALDAKTGIRLPKSYNLRHKDVVKIVTRPTAKQRR